MLYWSGYNNILHDVNTNILNYSTTVRQVLKLKPKRTYCLTVR